MQAWLLEHRRALALASGVAALLWVAMTWQAPAPRVAAAPAPVAAPNAPPAAAADASPPRASTEGAAPARADEPPPGVTGAQWRALQDELRGDPNGAAELARIADYLAWSDALRRWRESRGGDAVEARRLAREVDAGLPARLRADEVSAAEARQIKMAVLEATLDDPADRAAALKSWTASHASPATADPRQAEFDRRQAALVAAWSAQPARARDPAALERDLEALRRSVFHETPAPTPR